jgi:hypothetical protein
MLKLLSGMQSASYLLGHLLGFGCMLAVFTSILYLVNAKTLQIIAVPYPQYILCILLAYFIIVAITLMRSSRKKFARNVVD